MEHKYLILLALGLVAWAACEKVDTRVEEEERFSVELADVAKLLSEVKLGEEQIGEVFDAVNASATNGYDEEYMMSDLFAAPGTGVGDLETKASLKEYSKPLRDLLKEGLEARNATKSAGDGISVDEYLDALESSDIQIYWPYSEDWDGVTYPIFTYAPDDDSDCNIGYKLVFAEDGGSTVEEVLVDEELAMERPVWVVNRNDDSGHTTIEMLRKADPDWGMPGGGNIIIGTTGVAEAVRTKSDDESTETNKMLVLRDFTMLRNFDSWFGGASEFWVKMGSADGFRASTEAELKLYSPSLTDFVIVVRRSQKNEAVKFNAVVVSDWTDQIDLCALLITEDDGGDTTSWSCSIIAKVNSKSYGFEMTIPYKAHDDIVWRGSLSRNFIEAASGSESHFGDVDVCFELVEY